MRARSLVPVAVAVAVAVLALVFASCGSERSGPPDIAYGRDVCDECHMIISEARYASAYRSADGEDRIFDDIGDMIAFGRERDELVEATAWVHDYDTEAWLDAPDAWFVRADELETPMGGGVVAFATEASANAFAEPRDGEVLGWDELIASDVESGHGSHSDPETEQDKQEENP
jgi:copper chaperone NosL